jgi:hypothetical protein
MTASATLENYTTLTDATGVPANGGLTDVDYGPPTQTPPHSDAGIATSAERAVADSLHVESDRDRKPQPARSMTLVKSGPAASSSSTPAAAE